MVSPPSVWPRLWWRALMVLAVPAVFLWALARPQPRTMPLSPPPRATRAAETISATRPPHVWRLAFVRGRDIWVANGDGTGQRLILRNAESPSWSPDRKRLAFVRRGNVWVAEADGRNARPLTSFPLARDAECDPNGSEMNLAWNPVGDEITFCRPEAYDVRMQGAEEGTRLFVSALRTVPADARRPFEGRTLMGMADQGSGYVFGNHDAPAWTRDGKTLAFARNGDVWVAQRLDRRFEGRSWDAWQWDVTRLATPAEFDSPNYRASRCNAGVTRLSWSPDGKVLACGRRRLGGSGYSHTFLYQVVENENAIGGLRAELFRTIEDALEPSISPDGRWVVYDYEMNGAGLVAETLDGSRRVPLVPNGWQPVW